MLHFTSIYLGCVSLRKSKTVFCISLLNRLIQDHWDHGVSKEPKNPCSEWIRWFLWCTMIRVCCRDGAVVRVLGSHQCGPGSIPARWHMWVEFVVGSRPCSEGFSPGSPVFLPLQKLTLQIPIRSGNSGRRAPPWDMPRQIPIYFIFTFFFYI